MVYQETSVMDSNVPPQRFIEIIKRTALTVLEKDIALILNNNLDETSKFIVT